MKFLITPLDDIRGVAHGFFTREADRAAVAQALDADIVSVMQVHGIKALAVEESWGQTNLPQADALVTARPNLALAVVTADCAPVLFACAKRGVIGAAHAGWRGALGGVLESTLAEMKKLGADADDIEAAIGPCIGARSYEVSAGFETPFLAQDKSNAVFFDNAKRAGHLLFDLPGYVAHRLTQAGITRVHDTHRDTLADEASFHSYRRATLRGEKGYGLQLSAIVLKK